MENWEEELQLAANLKTDSFKNMERKERNVGADFAKAEAAMISVAAAIVLGFIRLFI